MGYWWSYFASVTSFLFRKRLPEYSDADYDRILFSEESQQHNDYANKCESTEATGYEGERRIGTITTLQADYGLIDQKYYFNLDDLNDRNVNIGQAVRYFAYRVDLNSDWRVKQINIVPADEWDTGFTEQTSRVICHSTVIRKSITAQVKKRNGRNLLFSGDIRCNLDKVSAAFSPIEGDWVELESDVELVKRDDEIPIERVVEVQTLQAVRPKTYHGKISHLSRDGNEVIGIINSEVYFRGNVCEPAYRPTVDDVVLAKVIESDQGALTSRAIFIIPVSVSTVNSCLLSTIEEERLFDSKHGVSVNAECDNKRLKLGAKTLFNITIENTGTEEQNLLGGNLIKLKRFMRITTPLEKSVCIPPSGSFLMTVEATAIGPGFFTDILVLNFAGEWQIGCLLDFYVDVEREGAIESQRDTTSSKPPSAKFEKRAEALKKVATKTGFQPFVPGRRPVKPASFLPVKLENYLIPNSIKDIYAGKDGSYRKPADIESDLVKLYPCLNEELNERNYKPKFHTLLHLEDIEAEIAIKKYDKERACFHRRGEYLELEIENLAESRPSLSIGDKLHASDPAVFGKSGDGLKYEGFIHKIKANSILLKFNESFHAAYDGKDYTVEFFRTRAPIRRCHQAVNVIAEKMSTKWLFPDSMGKLKPTQVNIVGEFPSKHEEKLHVCVTRANATTKASPTKSLNIMKEIEENSEEINEKKEEMNECKKENEVLKQAEILKPQVPHEYCQIRDLSSNVAIQWVDEKQKSRSINPASTTSRGSSIKRRDVVIKWVNSDLNHYQREAVRNVLKGEARPLPYIIFGPPGTGKTMTVVETVLQIAYLMPESRILIATPSNSSADLICERLLSWKLDLLTPGKLVRLVGYNHMLDNRISPMLKPYVSCIDMKISGAEDISYDDNGYKHSSRESIGRSRITVGTCVTVGVLYTLGFPKGHFTHIIVDEAGQAMEPEILIPLAFMNEDSHAILAGDPRQLGPVIMSGSAKVFGLGESLLSRFLMRFPYQRDPESYTETDGYDPRLVTKLLYNYRSLPDILYMYSTLFYDSSLISQICGICSAEAETLKILKKELMDSPWEMLSSVLFYGVRGINRQDDDSPSWYNDHEIFQVSKYVAALYKAGMKSTEIGIITPYQKQVMKLREHLRDVGFDLPKIGTVEEFQGQERPVIIVSTVRSDEGLLTKDRKYSLGFVASQQRLNVAISRARTMLIIVGNPHLLVKDLAWRNLLRLCIEKKCYFGTDLPNSLLREQIPV